MQVATVLVLLVTCELCLTIRVPSSWDQSASEVKQEIKNDNDEQFSVESFKPQIVNEKKPIPLEYFEYTAKKPQFAVDIAKFHGVQSPENHYKAYPIKPHTGILRPELGKHRIINKDNAFHQPLQEYTNINEEVVTHVVPVSSNYEVFHPYEAETPALQEIYKDPVLTKIRNDLENSKNRLQSYEKEAGEPDISKDEYLESPQKTDSKIGPHRNIPAPYEIHRPQRRPIYYRPVPITHHREQHLNQRLRHPWNQYSAKVRPIHYRPIKNHIHQLRQSHALKYDDERNEYPQVHILENYSDPKDGYDIYERGKDKFVQLRNNVDESINKAVKENRPATYEKLEVQNNGHSNDDNEEEFIPIKNYAQVRKTETFKHLPKSAALAEAETFDEIRNAPRLREAVKSTKAQTVYSEEGYEDSAYDHAGEQKHASENEGHGGFLKQHELSGGKYKTPSESAKYQDGGGSAYRDQKIHAEKWKDDNKDDKEQTDEDDYSEDENEKSIEADTYNDSSPDDGKRNKRENDIKNDTDTDISDVILNYKTNESTPIEKQRIDFKVPELDLKSTFLSEQEILNLKKIRNQAHEEDIIKQKYPYYSEKIRAISKHSPLRYAENLEYIPRKSKGGTEFYDSRSNFECPDVDDAPDPIPEKLKRDGHPDDNDDSGEESPSTKGDENYDTAKKTPRLKGLGDKIDCFKAKYFGENPLDSPFFKEEIISNPEPITPPNKLGLHHFKISIQNNEPGKAESRHVITENKNVDKKPDIFDIIEKIRSVQSVPFNFEEKSKDEIMILNTDLKNSSNMDELKLKQQSRIYNDILENIYRGLDSQKRTNINSINVTRVPNDLATNLPKNITYVSYRNKEDITKAPHVLKKRSTTFIYEPYKIIRDSQIPDSKKTTTTNNISPLIRKLQSSRIVDRVVNTSQEMDKSEKHVKRNVNTPRMYKDIGRKERESSHGSKNDKGSVDPSFIDVSIDKRRGEPRYEIRRPVNHKTSYAPVENKKSMSIEDYKAQKNGDSHLKGETTVRQQERTPVSKLTSDLDIQNIAESSNTVRKTVSTTTTKSNNQPTRVQHESDESLEDYEEYEDVEEETEISTTTTTTQKPSFRRRMKPKTTTEHIVESTERPKLKLVTRFRDYEPEERSELQEHSIDKSQKNNHNVNKEHNKEIPDSVPKYREKKKKSTKSTLVTDTKRYGDDDSDMRKEEVDALIGVKQDMDEYIPLYEKEEKNKLKTKHPSKGSTEDKEKQTDDDEVDDNDSDTDDDDDSHEDDDDEDDDEDDEDYDEEEENDSVERETEVTTPEPTKRTLEITTEAPTPTTAIRNAKLEAKPIVTRKKIEIHKELPANKSSPHTTEYKQDIKEVEIIKEIPMPPKKKPQKNLEAIELYKDDNLAKEINKLGSVEIFKEDIDLRNGPRHGGNYRQLEVPIKSAPLKEKATKDAVASQSAFTKHVELEDDIPRHRMHGGNLKSLTDIHKSRSRGRSEKLIELSDSSSTAMHGGNLKIRNRGRNSGKNQKLIELDDDHDHDDDDSSSDSHESFSSNSRGSRPMHGGNYRSAKIIVQDKKTTKDDGNGSRDRGARRNAAAILNSFVQAVPILTTTPAYILDPSKRMYYYVDTKK